MSEYLLTYTIPAGETLIPCPNKPINGIYADNSVEIAWAFNNRKGKLITGSYWEPHTPFNPDLTSKLVITATVQTNISIRVSNE